jgi:hypothetical protein
MHIYVPDPYEKVCPGRPNVYKLHSFQQLRNTITLLTVLVGSEKKVVYSYKLLVGQQHFY